MYNPQEMLGSKKKKTQQTFISLTKDELVRNTNQIMAKAVFINTKAILDLFYRKRASKGPSFRKLALKGRQNWPYKNFAEVVLKEISVTLKVQVRFFSILFQFSSLFKILNSTL